MWKTAGLDPTLVTLLCHYLISSYVQSMVRVVPSVKHLADKGLYSQSYGFSSSHVWMWELNHKQGWVSKNWCFQIVMLEKTLEGPLDCNEIKPVNLKGNQPWIYIGSTDVEAETNTFETWCKEPTHWKRPWCWERLRARGEGGDRGWDGWMASPTEFEQTPGDREGQGSLACCSPRSHKESDTTYWLNNKNSK